MEAEYDERGLRKEFLLLRQEGLTVDNVRRYCPTLINLPVVRILWEAEPARSAELTCGLLRFWLLELEEPRRTFAAAAFDCLDEIPRDRRANVVARRAWAAEQRSIGESGARYHEDGAIDTAISDLITASRAIRERELRRRSGDWAGVVEIAHGSQFYPVDVPDVVEIPPLGVRFRITNSESIYTYDTSRRLVSDHHEHTLEALDDAVDIYGMLFNYPGVHLQRLRLNLLEGCSLERFARFKDYFVEDLRLSRRLSRGDEHLIRFRHDVLGDGEFESFIPFTNAHDVEEKTVKVKFDPAVVPEKVWWFEGLALRAVPGYWAADRDLEAVGVATFERTFPSPDPGAFYFGIGWEW
jgi:hypothetical protein